MKSRNAKGVGLVGFGTIGSAIGRSLAENPAARLDFVVSRRARAASELPAEAEGLSVLPSLGGRDVQLVVEAVDADFVREHALDILEHADFVPFSLTSLVDDGFRERVVAKCAERGRTLYVPHGAVLGLDGIHDGRAVIDTVEITTTKHPLNLGLTEDQVGTVFDGSVRDACSKFPRNVNVHAAVALAGLGFDATRSHVVADPTSRRMRHEIVVNGDGLSWTITVESQAVGSVTGSYTPESAARTVKRVVAGTYGISIA